MRMGTRERVRMVRVSVRIRVREGEDEGAREVSGEGGDEGV